MRQIEGFVATCFAAVVLLTAGCTFDGQSPATHRCSAQHPECPEGLTCRNNTCVGPTEGGVADARPDGPTQADGPRPDAAGDGPADAKKDSPVDGSTADTTTADTTTADTTTDGPTVDGPAGDTTVDTLPADTLPDDITPPVDGACGAGAVQDCYTGAVGTQGVGECKAGQQSCVDGTWGICVGEKTPNVADLCDGKDDDCNGLDDDTHACVLGESTGCTTSCGTSGSRLCEAGCVPGACVASEVCNGLDDDCVGGADNGFECVQGASESCTTSCLSEGTKTCSGSCTWGACVPPAEICNGLDDDCVAGIDNGLTKQTYYEDYDGDTFGNPAKSLVDCKQPTGYVLDNTDCYDNNAAAKPGQTNYYPTHRGDGSYDYDCDGSPTKYYRIPQQCTCCDLQDRCQSYGGAHCGVSTPDCSKNVAIGKCGAAPGCALDCSEVVPQPCR